MGVKAGRSARLCNHPVQAQSALQEVNAKFRPQSASGAAINAPIQGTAVDIIRRAMVHMPALDQAKLKDAKMLLQVHDELIFEAQKRLRKTHRNRQNRWKAPAPRLNLSVLPVVDAQAANSGKRPVNSIIFFN